MLPKTIKSASQAEIHCFLQAAKQVAAKGLVRCSSGNISQRLDNGMMLIKASRADWKDLLTASFRKEARVVPNLEGNGFVALGMRTSNMSVPEFSDYLEFIHAFAAREGVDLSREDAA